ncbi:hypothetical protein FJ977_32570 [Mesorhizobium sp. B2-1-3A]|nr:hypothetical protein FJ977_32570 [Mesorhizobium sp. B2-1-3A]
MTKLLLSLGPIPTSLSDELFEKYREIERNFRERRWEPSELNGGKLCEVAYSILRGHVDGQYPHSATKPQNFPDSCRALEQAPSLFSRSIRIQIPRMLIALYEIRNNRGVGHVGGDVNPNHMDAVCVLQISKWVVSELVRVFHGVSTETATQFVDTISDREIALIWDTGKVKRVLDTSLTMLQKTLVILYSSASPIAEPELVRVLEHSNAAVYRRDVLKKAHKKRWLEYDPKDKSVQISPLGSREVEEVILPKSNL